MGPLSRSTRRGGYPPAKFCPNRHLKELVFTTTAHAVPGLSFVAPTETNIPGDALCLMVTAPSLLQRLAVGGWRLVAVCSGWQLAVGSWRLAVHGGCP